MKPSAYLVQYENRLYCYEREDLLKISIIENSRIGLPPDGIWKLEAVGFGYEYAELNVDDLLTPKEIPVQQLSSVA